ncbi:T9SS type A sorting domain-containing protein [Flavobacterium sp.]|uniref:T9SS type A sorting domain-containing protein n=1 Tax=Flavobacterium sp. TaxID=239 RepID=UPI00286A04E5|nr:T9SS type A sorting domain-containing protein [Flavobacterium sp.]
MKSALYLLLFFTSFTFAQITLEHTYDDNAVTRVKLEYSGEKYYLLKKATNELIFYNADHTLWKTIALPASTPNTFVPTKVFHVSESKINPDTNLEIIFGYFNASTTSYESKIISESGTVLLTLLNSIRVYMSEISGLPDKLITENATGSSISIVYSVPELTLENTYTDGKVSRIKLENSAEKYYLLDKVNNNAKIYNSNHSLWKTVSLPKPINAIYTNIDVISETQLNPDAVLEIGYSYSETVSSNSQYESKIVNENNVVLLTVPNSKHLSISSIEGLQNKLIAHIQINSGIESFGTSIFDLPSLTLENAYSNKVTRVKLENSGEKYYTSSPLLDSQAKIYNGNHTLWKALNLPLPTESVYQIDVVSNLSESKINPDALIELSYTYVVRGLLEPYHYSRVINENGTILLQADGVLGMYLNEIQGLNDKLIGYTYDFNNNSYVGKVYSFGTLKTLNYYKNDKVFISPNPAKSFLNINSIFTSIIEATIYNMNGALVKKEISQNITKIDIDKLPTGIYIVNLTDFNNQKSTHKITILH